MVLEGNDILLVGLPDLSVLVEAVVVDQEPSDRELHLDFVVDLNVFVRTVCEDLLDYFGFGFGLSLNRVRIALVLDCLALFLGLLSQVVFP